MKKSPLAVLSLILILLTLSACQLPPGQPNAVATDDLVATEVARILTETAQAQPSLEPTQPPTAELPATAKPQPSPTDLPVPTPTEMPAPTVTPVQGDPAASLGEPSWQDDLSSARNFYLYDNDNTVIESSPDGLLLKGLTAIGWHGWSLTYTREPANFYLEGTFKSVSCSGSDMYGLVFRANKENAGYFFGATCDGRYNLYKRDFNDGTAVEIIMLSNSDAIVQGANATNRLGIQAQGDTLRLYANGALLNSVNDSAYSKGFFGPFIASYNAGFTFILDHIKLWETS